MNKRVMINPRKKQIILERDSFKCVKCGASGDFNCLEVDHIIPFIEGGTNEDSNLQTLCYKCNMEKKWKKDKIKQDYLDFSPLERLKLIKDRLILYKDLTYPEFKVIFTQDELFRKLRIDLMYINELFFEVSGKKKLREGITNVYKEQRNKLITFIKDYSGKTYQELSLMLKEKDINMSFQQIAKICSKFDSISSK